MSNFLSSTGEKENRADKDQKPDKEDKSEKIEL